jgi:hypothetical protein
MIEDQHSTAGTNLNLPESGNEASTGEANKTALETSEIQQLNSPQKENPSEILNPQQTQMEIYHHPDLHHKKKPWKEYFLEFLMIFLAVTLGFFAESLRQYISDKGHVRQLASQLIQDLKNDSTVLSNNVMKDTQRLKKSDSLFYLLQQPPSKLDTKRLQELIIACYSIDLYQPATGAIFAIKNELHLKQFARSNITLYISDFETLQALLKTIESFQEANLKEYVQGFITAHFTPINVYSSLSTIDNGPITNGELRNVTANDLTQLGIDIVIVKNYNALLAEISRQLMVKASEFIQYTSKEFE